MSEVNAVRYFEMRFRCISVCPNPPCPNCGQTDITSTGHAAVKYVHVAELEAEVAALLEACKALQMEARARHCGLRIADEAIAKTEQRLRGAGPMRGRT